MANELDLHQPRRMKRARNPEQREQQLAALAVDLSEQRLRDGTASSAEIVYWLKQASPQVMLERENLKLQNDLLKAKRNAIEKEGEDNQIYLDAMNAFAGYSPSAVNEIIEGEFDEK